jgi:hypothetical protein
MSESRRLLVGLFAEGGGPADPDIRLFESMWQLLAAHCHRPVELKVFGISKGQIDQLRVDALPSRAGATQLMKQRGRTVTTGRREALDTFIARTARRESLDRVVVAFDAEPGMRCLAAQDLVRRCVMRREVTFLLRQLADSDTLDSRFRDAARRLLDRYGSDSPLRPRAGPREPTEVIFMEPMFEALFQADEPTVRSALGFDREPKDWPKFRTHERAIDRFIVDRAVAVQRGRRSGDYLSRKSRWGHEFVSAARPGAALWRHPIATRLCATLAE